MTNTGVPVYVEDSELYNTGDRAYITFSYVGSNGYIKGEVSEDQSGIEDEDFDDYRWWFIIICFLI